jgi:hypothetical protein
MRHAQRDEIGPRNAKLVGDAMDFAFFDGRDRLVGGRHLEQAPHQGELLIVGGERRKLSRDQEIGGSAKQEIAGLRQLHHNHRLVGQQLAVFANERFHDARFLRRHGLIGMRNAAEQVGKRTEIPGALRFEMIQRVERLAQGRGLVVL